MSEAAPHHTRYSGQNCVNAWRAAEPRYTRSERGKRVKTVRHNHFGGALLAAAAGLLAAVGLVVFLYAQPAQANFPGKPGKIAYAGEDGTDLVIYTIKTDGGGKRPLTATGATNREPAYSPNGKRIAYTGYDGKDYEIYTINAGGGGTRQLTHNSTDDFYPSYSPSGKKIAYVYDATGTDGEIWTIQLNGDGKHQVTNNANNDRNPYWGSQ